MVKTIYIVLCILGVLLPYSQLAPWVLENGLSPILAVQQIMASKISALAWLDVVVSAVALLFFVNVESRRIGMQRIWLVYLGTLTVGVSLGLPLFLLMREHYLSFSKPSLSETDTGIKNA